MKNKEETEALITIKRVNIILAIILFLMIALRFMELVTEFNDGPAHSRAIQQENLINTRDPERQLDYRKLLDDDTFHAKLGWEYYQQGRVEHALHHYYEAFRINSADPLTANNIGFFHFQLGDLPRAEKFLLHALELDPKLELARNNLVDVYTVCIEKAISQEDAQKYQEMLTQLTSQVETKTEAE